MLTVAPASSPDFVQYPRSVAQVIRDGVLEIQQRRTRDMRAIDFVEPSSIAMTGKPGRPVISAQLKSGVPTSGMPGAARELRALMNELGFSRQGLDLKAAAPKSNATAQ
jgi:hypothetical protein